MLFRSNVWCTRKIERIKQMDLCVGLRILEEFEFEADIAHTLNEAEKRWCKTLSEEGHKLTNILLVDAMSNDNVSAALIDERPSHGNKGKVRTPEMLARMSASRKGRKASSETKRKMSETRKGRKFSEEHRAALKESWHETHPQDCWEQMATSRRGKQRSEKTKRRLSESNRKSAAKGWETRRANQQADRKSTRLNSSHVSESRMPSSA